MFKTNCLKLGLLTGEQAWEVMEQSETVGEIPVRLVISSVAIRTVTSLILSRPEDIIETWQVVSQNIIKMSWCPELCVLSILYVNSSQSPDSRKELVKVFLCHQFVGPKIIKSYKKIKPVTVHLSPSRPFNRNPEAIGTSFTLSSAAPGTAGPLATNRSSGVTVIGTTKPSETDNHLSASFVLPSSLKHEKMWRAVTLSDELPKETFIGISPSNIRVIDSTTHEPEMVVDHLHIMTIRHDPGLSGGGDTLKLKFLEENGKGKTKKKKLTFSVHPVVGRDMMKHYEFCMTIAEEVDLCNEMPSFKINLPQLEEFERSEWKEEPSSDRLREERLAGKGRHLGRAQSEGTLKRLATSGRERTKKVSEVSEGKPLPLAQPSSVFVLPSGTGKQTKTPLNDFLSENKENVNPNSFGTNLKAGVEKNMLSLKMGGGDPQLQLKTFVPPQKVSRSKSSRGMIKI